MKNQLVYLKESKVIISNGKQYKPGDIEYKGLLIRLEIQKADGQIQRNRITEIGGVLNSLNKRIDEKAKNERLRKDGIKEAAQERVRESAKRFKKLLESNKIAITGRLTAGKAIKILREKGVHEKDIPDRKTVQRYLELLTASPKVTIVKKVS